MATPDEPTSTADEATPALTGLPQALELVGDRWTLLVIAALLGGARRFGDLQEEVQGIAPNVLTQRLRALTADGLVIASAYSQRPPRFVYELTAGARDLEPALALLAAWGAGNVSGAETPRHDACGTPLELRWWCPVCREPGTGTAQEPGPDEDLHYA